jgi:hypothetical protein
MAKKKLGIGSMKLIAIKNECYAISEIATLNDLKQKYVTLCKGRDFRKRQNWEYILTRLRADADWMGVTLTDIENNNLKEKSYAKKPVLSGLTFRAERPDWDKAAESDD